MGLASAAAFDGESKVVRNGDRCAPRGAVNSMKARGRSSDPSSQL
jgi:hypothetical protein